MLVTQYGIERPTRVNYGVDDNGPRGMFETASQEVIAYSLWILNSPDGTQISEEDFANGVLIYLAAHFSLAGWSMDTGVPIPPSQPEDLPSMTFLQYLDVLGIGYMENLFTYAHSVQGYGDLADIPAYYGLLWIAPDIFTAQLDLAASITEQMAEAAEDAETGLRLVRGASAMRHGSKVARRFKRSTAKEFQQGVRPSFEETSDLAARCHQYVLEGEDDDEAADDEGDGDDEAEESVDAVYLMQEGYGSVWDKLVHQEGFRSKIKLGATVMNIERRGLGDYQ